MSLPIKVDRSNSDEALAQAGALLRENPANVAAHEVAARAYDCREAPSMAQHHYAKAVEISWNLGEHDTATRIFLDAIRQHPKLLLSPAKLLSIAGQLARNNKWDQAGALWVRIIEEFPNSSEAEIAFLRSAQMWSSEFKDNNEAARQLTIFVRNYPQSSWRPQVEQALNTIYSV